MSEKNYKKSFLELMRKEELQLPKRVDDDFEESLCHLLDFYMEQLTFISDIQKQEIQDICNHLKTMASMINDDGVLTEFEYMMKYSKLSSYLHIIKNNLPIDGYAIKNANLFRVREYDENKNYKRKDIFHVPANLNKLTRSLRYNIAGCPSLYLGSTIYECCDEMGKNEKDHLFGSMFRLRENLDEDALYIVDIGVRPADYTKYVKFTETGRRAYTYTQYLYVYPLIAACSFIAANKSHSYIKEYSISNALFRWANKHYADKICGVRYFSCAKKEYMIKTGDTLEKESDSNRSFTQYFINYAFSIESDTKTFSKKLSDAFVVTKPKIMQDYLDIKDFEKNIKKDVHSLRHIEE